MLPAFILGIGLLVGLTLIARWYAQAEPKTLLRVLTWVAFIGIAAMVVFMAVSGRLGLATAGAAALLPLATSLIRAFRTARTYTRMGGASSGQTSTVETATLRMILDHDTGALDGDVKSGRFAGRRLSTLTLAELIELYRACRTDDGQAASLLETYLDRTHPEWRSRTDGHGAGEGGAGQGERTADHGPMTREEAYRILGLQPGASEAEIAAAYRRLIAILHPDRGGSSFLAAQVNRARDVLLGR